MKIEIENDNNGNTIQGYYRELYETQHGKNEENDKLQVELANCRQELAELKEENSQLRGETLRKFRLGRARRSNPILCELPLVRHVSEHAARKIGEDEKENDSPPFLDLNRAKTTLAW